MSKRKPEVYVHTLIEPIEITNTVGEVIKTISKVSLKRKIKAKHLKGVNLTLDPVPFDHLIRLVANLGGLNDIEIGEVGFQDIQEMVGIAAGFLAPTATGQETGQEPSPPSEATSDSQPTS